MTVSEISVVRIHPGIGVARVGDSERDFFVGPEAPGIPPHPVGGFKDSQGRMKRQAVRFRIYASNEDGSEVHELTANEARITWRVHVANKKGAWYRFRQRGTDVRRLRNPDHQGGEAGLNDPDSRSDLIIDPGPVEIGGAGHAPVALDGGAFLGVPVGLGDVWTDDAGRLMFAGGHGRSEAVDPAALLRHYADNDAWFDDTSDGLISATVDVGGRELHADPAWVVTAPPDFAPHTRGVITMLDTARAAAIEAGWIDEPDDTEFHRDVLPLLDGLVSYAWVAGEASRGHRPIGLHGRVSGELAERLADPGGDAALRRRIVERVRVPATLADDDTRRRQASAYYMPPMSGDGGTRRDGDPDSWLTVLPHQYRHLQRWADGDFAPGAPVRPVPFRELDAAAQPSALDRAALEHCVGGSFHPGIEMTYTAAAPDFYRAPLRVHGDLLPGDVGKGMAVPWQADFYDCGADWWPTQRPAEVVSEEAYDGVLVSTEGSDVPLANALADRERWARGLSREPVRGRADMVRYWSELGVVLPKEARGETVLVEQERARHAGFDPRQLFHELINLDSYPDVMPKARRFVDSVLADARAVAHGDDPETPYIWRFFPYSEVAFRARLNDIYADLIDNVDGYHPARDTFKTRAQLDERIIQFAAFNLTDGAWLRNVGHIGPIDRVRALLFSVFQDELGNGDEARNHANIYQNLLRSIGFYPGPVHSRAFAMDERFLTSAFVVPAFQLAIAAHTTQYFPEILGMTMQLEWMIVDSKNTARLLEYHGLDPHFYTMHVGIDNPHSGHAARAVEAVQLYLADVQATSGDADMQRQWERIWTGFVAFGTTGTMGQDLFDLVTNPPSVEQQVVSMIEAKARYGALNHGGKRLDGTAINDWFADPRGFMNALAKSSWVVPGQPENSALLRLLEFDGPMVGVFEPHEIKLWERWIASLAVTPPPPGPDDPAREMAALVRSMRSRQAGIPAHESRTLPDADGDQHPVSWWFRQDPRRLLAALADPAAGWIVPGDVGGSRLVTDLLGNNPMGRAIADHRDPQSGRDGREIVTAWIEAGCPLPEPIRGRVRNLSFTTAAPIAAEHPTQRILGMGSVH